MKQENVEHIWEIPSDFIVENGKMENGKTYITKVNKSKCPACGSAFYSDMEIVQNGKTYRACACDSCSHENLERIGEE